MAYDSTRRKTVLFGGSSGSNETWEWDGTTWTQRFANGPSSRMNAAMVFDARSRVTILFGGYRQTSFGDTWAWDGQAWSQRLISGPSARMWHVMAYDASRGGSILFGGGPISGPFNNETWELTSDCVADLDDGTGSGISDGGVTTDDLLYYLDLYATLSLRADLDNGTYTGTPDGGVTIDDLLFFLERFQAGC